MRVSLIVSALFHVAVIVVAIFGLPFWKPDPIDIPPPAVEVEIVSDIEDTVPEPEPEAPKPQPKPTKAPPPKPTPPAPKPEPAPEEVKPEPKAQPEPEPEVEPIPVEKPKELEPKKPEPKKPEPKPVEKPKTVVKMPHPAAKPKEPPRDDFSSVLKTVEKLEDKPRTPKTQDKPKKKEEPKKAVSLEEALAKALKKDNQPKRKDDRKPQMGQRLTDSEMDAVKQQIASNWNIQPGARDAENLIVRLRVLVNPDMSVRSVQIVDNGESSNPFWAAASRSARTAVLKSSPLELPPGKYDVWQVINFTFDPKQMF
ncbi:hypothetical protein [Aestuariispira ectoiniformans]|uniref:hypothetical protein n=1 Tax=Aestuariispira ectoiniformans TaxID=2775080 RepID=UPI00223A9C4F|nr:hypothetical protein [Aestuariispira ectoiniformans]